jgi:drug/metabolite transporter (DMT)-like permease
MPARLAAACFGVWMILLALAYHYLSAWHTATWAVAGISGVFVVLGGMRRNEPTRRGPWRLLALVVALSALGAVTSTTLPSLLDEPATTPSISDGIALAVYPVLAIALLLFVRFRAGATGAACSTRSP